jgi:hypothetical protein
VVGLPGLHRAHHAPEAGEAINASIGESDGWCLAKAWASDATADR